MSTLAPGYGGSPTVTFHDTLKEMRRGGVGLRLLPGGAQAYIRHAPVDTPTGPLLPDHMVHQLVKTWHVSQRRLVHELFRMPGVRVLDIPEIGKIGSASPAALALVYTAWRHAGLRGLGGELAPLLEPAGLMEASVWCMFPGKALRFGMWPPDPGHDPLGWKRWHAAILYTPESVSQFAGMGVAAPEIAWVAHLGGFFEVEDPVPLFNATYMKRGRVFGEEGDGEEVDILYPAWREKRARGIPTTRPPDSAEPPVAFAISIPQDPAPKPSPTE